MDYSEINTMIKRLVEQLQNITPQLELARGKEAWVMQETQDSEIVEEKIEEVFVAVYKNIEMSMKIAVQLQDICPHPLIKETIDQLHNLNYSPLPMCMKDLETKKASLWKGYVEDYIDNTKDTLVAINRLSQELSEVSLSLFISHRLRNIIGEIGVLRGQFAAYEYSGIDFPNPYDIIKRKIARLLNDIKSAQEICIQVSKNAAATLIKLYHSFSDVKGLVNRNFSKGETPIQKLKSIQDDLSQAFKKIEMEYRDLLEEFAVEFEVAHIKFVKSAEAEQSASQKPAGAGQENEDVLQLTKAERLAYQSYEYAITQKPELADTKDDKTYDWLKENGPPDYELPSCETWKRQVRAGRKHHGTQKNTLRAGRSGHSIAQSGQLQSLSEISSQYTNEAD